MTGVEIGMFLTKMAWIVLTSQVVTTLLTAIYDMIPFVRDKLFPSADNANTADKRLTEHNKPRSKSKLSPEQYAADSHLVGQRLLARKVLAGFVFVGTAIAAMMVYPH